MRGTGSKIEDKGSLEADGHVPQLRIGYDQIPLVTPPPTSNTGAMKVRCNELAGEEADYGRNEFPMLRGQRK